jgi:hypothetical protein
MTFENTLIGFATHRENFLLFETAIVLGRTSPKRRMRGVIMAIAIHFP